MKLTRLGQEAVDSFEKIMDDYSPTTTNAPRTKLNKEEVVKNLLADLKIYAKINELDWVDIESYADNQVQYDVVD